MRHLPSILVFAFCLLAGVLSFPPPAAAQVRTLRATAYAGKRYVALADIASLYGLPLKVAGKKIVVEGRYTKLEFAGENRQAVLNGVSVWLHAPVYQVKGKWSVSDADAQFLVDPVVRPTAYIGSRGTRTVMLDPGHGGKDPGAIAANGLQEKAVALDIALRVRAILSAAGVRVLMTREKDVFVDLAARPAAAAKQKADLFVSIHLNATANTAVHGLETYITAVEDYPPTTEPKLAGKYPRKPNNAYNHSNSVLGHQLQKAVQSITRAEDRGLRHARFVVIRESTMPAILVECGYLTNPTEANRLSTSSYRDTIAQGIAQGILNYFSLVNQAKRGSPPPAIQRPPAQQQQPAPPALQPKPQPPAPQPQPKPAPQPAPPQPAPHPVPQPQPRPQPAPPPPQPAPQPAPAAVPPPVSRPVIAPQRPIAAPPGAFLAPSLSAPN